MIQFSSKSKVRLISNKLGFIIMYFIFTAVLYFVLLLLHKLPENWTYFHIIPITIFIVLIGVLIKLSLR